MGMNFRSIMIALAVLACFFAVLAYLGSASYKKYGQPAASPSTKAETRPVNSPTVSNDDLTQVAAAVNTFKQSFVPMPFKTIADALESVSANLLLVEATLPTAQMEGERLEDSRARELQQEFAQFLEQYRDAATRLKGTYEELTEVRKEEADLKREIYEASKDKDPNEALELAVKEMDLTRKEQSIISFDRMGKEQHDIKSLQTTFYDLCRRLEKVTRPRTVM
jgi:hypothetical protein